MADQNDLDNYYREQSCARAGKDVARVRDDVIQFVGKRFSGGRLLDVGCGYGEFVKLMRERGVDAVGVEPNVAQARFCADQGVPCINDVLERDIAPAGSFDVVTLFQVLEHLPNPKAALGTVYSLLKPGGMIIVQVPSYHNPRILLYGAVKIKRLVKRDFIESHLFYFTPQTLYAFVTSAGFDVVRLSTGRYAIRYGKGFSRYPLKVVDYIADKLRIGGITLHARKSAD
jgi:2-polyprenyl-3-methyl-5-hydroxy-6-metoxy-1,4-benzoquinol methylase